MITGDDIQEALRAGVQQGGRYSKYMDHYEALERLIERGIDWRLVVDRLLDKIERESKS